MVDKPVAIHLTTLPTEPVEIGVTGLQLKDLLWEFFEHPVQPLIVSAGDPVTYYLRGVHDATKRDPDLRKEITEFQTFVRDQGALRLVVEPQPPRT